MLLPSETLRSLAKIVYRTELFGIIADDIHSALND